MTDPSDGPPQPPTPGERRLAHPPSDRYRVADDVAPAVEKSASATRGVAYASLAAVGGAVATTVLGGVLAFSAGLLVVAAVTGWAIAIGLRFGAGPHLTSAVRRRLALVLTTVAVLLGQIGLWVYARYEGGVLGPFDYLGETFGLLVPLQLVIPWITSWVSAR